MQSNLADALSLWDEPDQEIQAQLAQEPQVQS